MSAAEHNWGHSELNECRLLTRAQAKKFSKGKEKKLQRRAVSQAAACCFRCGASTVVRCSQRGVLPPPVSRGHCQTLLLVLCCRRRRRPSS